MNSNTTHILLVEDGKWPVQTIGQLLRSENYKISLAANLLETIDKLLACRQRGEKVNVILTCIAGKTVSKFYQEHIRALCNVPVITVSRDNFVGGLLRLASHPGDVQFKSNRQGELAFPTYGYVASGSTAKAFRSASTVYEHVKDCDSSSGGAATSMLLSSSSGGSMIITPLSLGQSGIPQQPDALSAGRAGTLAEGEPPWWCGSAVNLQLNGVSAAVSTAAITDPAAAANPALAAATVAAVTAAATTTAATSEAAAATPAATPAVTAVAAAASIAAAAAAPVSNATGTPTAAPAAAAPTAATTDPTDTPASDALATTAIATFACTASATAASSLNPADSLVSASIAAPAAAATYATLAGTSPTVPAATLVAGPTSPAVATESATASVAPAAASTTATVAIIIFSPASTALVFVPTATPTAALISTATMAPTTGPAATASSAPATAAPATAIAPIAAIPATTNTSRTPYCNPNTSIITMVQPAPFDWMEVEQPVYYDSVAGMEANAMAAVATTDCTNTDGGSHGDDEPPKKRGRLHEDLHTGTAEAQQVAAAAGQQRPEATGAGGADGGGCGGVSQSQLSVQPPPGRCTIGDGCCSGSSTSWLQPASNLPPLHDGDWSAFTVHLVPLPNKEATARVEAPLPPFSQSQSDAAVTLGAGLCPSTLPAVSAVIAMHQLPECIPEVELRLLLHISRLALVKPSVTPATPTPSQQADVAAAARGESLPWLEIAKHLSPNDTTLVLKLVEKAAAAQLVDFTHAKLSLNAPEQEFMWRWGRAGVLDSCTLDKRRYFLCLVAASGNVQNFKAALNIACCTLTAAIFRAAAAAGKCEMCNCLLDLECPHDGALAAAAGAGLTATCEWLLSRGLPVDAHALDAAASNGHVTVVWWLIGKLNFRDFDAGSLLVAAAVGCDLQSFKALLTWSEQHLNFSRNLLTRGIGSKMLTAAAGSSTPDWKEKVDLLSSHGCLTFEDSCSKAAMLRDACDRLAWLQLHHNFPMGAQVAEVLGQAGNLAAIQQLLATAEEDKATIYRDRAVQGAAAHGHLDIVKALFPINDRSAAWRAATVAAIHRHAHIVGWLVVKAPLLPSTHQDGGSSSSSGGDSSDNDGGGSNAQDGYDTGSKSNASGGSGSGTHDDQANGNSKRSLDLWNAAVQSGSVEVILELQKHGWALDQAAFVQAAGVESVEGLKMLVEYGCPLPKGNEPCIHAIRGGNLAILPYLESLLGCQLDKDTLVGCLERGVSIEELQCLAKLGFWIDVSDIDLFTDFFDEEACLEVENDWSAAQYVCDLQEFASWLRIWYESQQAQGPMVPVPGAGEAGVWEGIRAAAVPSAMVCSAPPGHAVASHHGQTANQAKPTRGMYTPSTPKAEVKLGDGPGVTSAAVDGPSTSGANERPPYVLRLPKGAVVKGEGQQQVTPADGASVTDVDVHVEYF